MAFRRYSVVFAVTVAVLALLVLAFNRLVDPFWYYRDASIEGLNAIKTKFEHYERHVKPSVVQREQPASLIFGSSFAEVGFDPLHPALRAAGTSYNFGIAGAQWPRVACNVQFALEHDGALRQIILGIHPQPMPAQDCRADLATMEHPDEKAFLFSLDALQASINTVLEQRKGMPTHTAEGQYFYARGKAGTANRFREVFAINPVCEIAGPQVNAPNAGSQTPRPPLDIAGLRDIVRAAAAKGIKVKLMVYPRHALSFEQEYQCGRRQARWDELRQIVATVEQEAGAMAEVWDFEGYHAIGTEAISDGVAKYWQDPTHFNYEFGNVMLDDAFSVKPAVLGERLTLANLPARAERELVERRTYLEGHPEFLAQLASLLPRHAE